MNKRIIFYALAAFMMLCTHAIASDAVDIGCKKLHLVFDSKIDASIVERDWGSGAPHNELPAVLELINCKGQIIDRATLSSSLARIDPAPLRGAPAPTYLVSADLTQMAGTYNGPLTIPFQVFGNHLQPITAVRSNGILNPVHLASTGKASWKKIGLSKKDILLSVNSERTEAGFVTHYKDYEPHSSGWTMRERSENGLWESDGDFPSLKKFPH